MRAIPECLIGMFTTRCYTNPRLPTYLMVRSAEQQYTLYKTVATGKQEVVVVVLVLTTVVTTTTTTTTTTATVIITLIIQ